MMEKIEIGGYFFEVDKFVAEHIRLLEGELDDSCRSVVEKSEHIVKLEVENEKMQRLIIYAGGILGHGNPGSAWMDWTMRVQTVLGMKFHESRFKNGNAIPLKELENIVKDIPRMTVSKLKALRGE